MQTRMLSAALCLASCLYITLLYAGLCQRTGVPEFEPEFGLMHACLETKHIRIVTRSILDTKSMLYLQCVSG